MINSRNSMRSNSRLLLLAVLGLLLACLPPVAFAQGETESENEFEGLGNIFAQLESWINQPVGAGFAPSSLVDAARPFNTYLLGVPYATEARNYIRGGYRLRDNMGERPGHLHLHGSHRPKQPDLARAVSIRRAPHRASPRRGVQRRPGRRLSFGSRPENTGSPPRLLPRRFPGPADLRQSGTSGTAGSFISDPSTPPTSRWRRTFRTC